MKESPRKKEAGLPGPASKSQVSTDINTPVPETQNFGPFLGIPSEEILETNFHCSRCNRRVRKFLKYIPEAFDCMGIYVCRCISAAAFQLENPPNSSRHWRHLVKFGKKTRTQIVVLSPKAGAVLHGQGSN